MAQSLEVNGVEIAFERQGSGEPLVLLHGFTGCREDWREVFQAPPPGFMTIAVDLRGHGESTNPGGEFTHRQAALDVLALLDHLDIATCKAIGLSCGAKALLHLATRCPERVAAQVLVSAAPYFPDSARTLMRQVTVETRSADDWRTMRTRHRHGDDQIRALWRQCAAFADCYDDVNFTPPLLATIRARTLIVHGDRDPFYPVELALEMYRAIPRSSLWVVPDGWHGPIFGAMAGAFAERALAFLRGDGPQGG
jgi:pimeloyl-ACP methyl ester carboxylesterase